MKEAVACEGACLRKIERQSCSLGSSKEVAIRFFLPSKVDIIGAPVPAIEW